MKKQKKKGSILGRLLWWVLLLAAVAVFLASGYKLLSTWLEYKAAKDEYKNLEQYAVVDDRGGEDDKNRDVDDPKEEQEESDPGPQIDFASLRAINSDVVGWLVIDALDLSYPIAQSQDNDFYLHRTIEKSYNFAGSIFLDYENRSDFSDCNTIVYGHNMKDGSMFGTLKKFREPDIYQKSLYFWICTPEKNYRYRIFAAYETAVGSETYTLFSETGEEYSAYLTNMMKLTEIPTDQTGIDAGKRIVTLSTCTGNSSTRFVVQGVCCNDERPLQKRPSEKSSIRDKGDDYGSDSTAAGND